LKQLTADPWSSVHETYEVGQVRDGRVTRHADFGAFVELEPGIEGGRGRLLDSDTADRRTSPSEDRHLRTGRAPSDDDMRVGSTLLTLAVRRHHGHAGNSSDLI